MGLHGFKNRLNAVAGILVVVIPYTYTFTYTYDYAFVSIISTTKQAIQPPISFPGNIAHRISKHSALFVGPNDDSINSSIDEEQFFSPNVELKDGIDERLLNASSDFDTEQESTNEYSFFDEAIIFVRAGSGGQGSSTYKKAPGGQNGQPDGGDGGKGGDVFLVADDSLNTLAGLTRAWRPNSFGGGGAATNSMGFRPMSFRAENGEDGKRQFKSGKYGKVSKHLLDYQFFVRIFRHDFSWYAMQFLLGCNNTSAAWDGCARRN